MPPLLFDPFLRPPVQYLNICIPSATNNRVCEAADGGGMRNGVTAGAGTAAAICGPIMKAHSPPNYA